MLRNKRNVVSRVAFLAAFGLAGQIATAVEVPVTKEVQNLIDYQCHGAKTLKQAQDNYTNMGRGYTDAHPVMVCLKKKIEELKTAGK
jgi:hypothetical protein